MEMVTVTYIKQKEFFHLFFTETQLRKLLVQVGEVA